MARHRPTAAAFAMICAWLLGAASAGAEPTTNAEWLKYLQSIDLSKLQPGCVPRVIPSAPEAAHRGAVFLVHGFTACPQQFLEWGDLLAQRGWTVYLFLLPGQGRLRGADGTDDLSGMPGHGDYRAYSELAEAIARVAEAEKRSAGPSGKGLVVGGLSIGGVVALDAAVRAGSGARFDRVILLSPTFAVADFAAREVAPKLTGIPPLANIVSGWGEACEEEGRLGRAGICHFTLGDIGTVEDYSDATRRLVASRPLNDSVVEVVGVGADKVVDTRATYDVLGSIGRRYACLYPSPANHSLLSRFDTPQEDKFWLGSLLADVTEFVDRGTPVPQVQSELVDGLMSECRIKPPR